MQQREKRGQASTGLFLGTCSYSLRMCGAVLHAWDRNFPHLPVFPFHVPLDVLRSYSFSGDSCALLRRRKNGTWQCTHMHTRLADALTVESNVFFGVVFLELEKGLQSFCAAYLHNLSIYDVLLLLEEMPPTSLCEGGQPRSFWHRPFISHYPSICATSSTFQAVAFIFGPLHIFWPNSS